MSITRKKSAREPRSTSGAKRPRSKDPGKEDADAHRPAKRLKACPRTRNPDKKEQETLDSCGEQPEDPEIEFRTQDPRHGEDDPEFQRDAPKWADEGDQNTSRSSPTVFSDNRRAVNSEASVLSSSSVSIPPSSPTPAQPPTGSAWDHFDEVDLYPALLWDFKKCHPPKLTEASWKPKRPWGRPGPSPLSSTACCDRRASNLRATFEAHLARELSEDTSDGWPKPVRQVGKWGAWARANYSEVRIQRARRKEPVTPPLAPALHRRRALKWLYSLPADASPARTSTSIVEREFFEGKRKAAVARGVESVPCATETPVAGKGTLPGPRDFSDWPSLARPFGHARYTARLSPEAYRELGRPSPGGESVVEGSVYRRYKGGFARDAVLHRSQSAVRMSSLPDDASIKHWLTEKAKCLHL